MPLEYDPTAFGSDAEYAEFRAGMERDLGMPRERHPDTPVGRRINEIHYQRDKAMNDDLGWHGTTDEDLRKKWGFGG